MGRVVLWHLPPSQFSEKVRWALEHKGVEHERRVPPPPLHMGVSLWLSRGRAWTLPALELDGERVVGSAACVAALERRFPDPALVPPDAAGRARALELERFFDAGLGPAGRRVALHHVVADHDAMREFGALLLPGPLADDARARGAAAALGRRYLALRFGAADAAGAKAAEAVVLHALDRLDAELDGDPSRYLVGERFTSADLAVAALFVPVVTPAQGPPLDMVPASFDAWRAPLRERPGFRWVERIFAEHRHR